MAYLIGVDGGGTGCRAIVSDLCGKFLGKGTAGPANVTTHFEEACENINSAVREAFAVASLPLSTIAGTPAYLGLAGANIGDNGERVVRRLPFDQFKIVTDAEISLQGAIGDEDGAVAIIGTGSVFICRAGNKVETVGGWGFMVGDLGSGARLGRALLQETLLAFDGVRDATPLTSAVLRKFLHNPRTIVEYAHTARPGEFGSFAPMVFEYADKHDPIAVNIVTKAVADVEETLNALLFSKTNQRLCMLGGLGSIYKNLLSQQYRDIITEPVGDAASGAIAMAVKSFGQGATHA